MGESKVVWPVAHIGARVLAWTVAVMLALAGSSMPRSAYALAGEVGELTQGIAASTSGRESVGKMTVEEQKNALASLKAPAFGSLWSVAPDVKAYQTGELSDQSLTYAAGHINLVRRVAGLQPIDLTKDLNSSAAAGALILSRLDDGLTHFPRTPDGITDDQAAAGKFACSHSNISNSYGYTDPLGIAVAGQMADSSVSNMTTVGHRRWLLWPESKTMGVGSARSESGNTYTVVRVSKRECRYVDVQLDLDRDDGLVHYDVEFKVGTREYEYDINAVTGEVMSRSVEIDD